MTEKFLIGTYTQKTSKGVYQIELDTDQKQLENAQLIAKISCPTYVVESDDHKIYAIDRNQDESETRGGLAVFDGSTMPAKLMQEDIEVGPSPAYITVDEGRKMVYTANYHTGNVIAYHIEADGTVKESQRIHDDGMTGPLPEQQSGPHPHYADLTPDDRLVICDLGLDRVYLDDVSDEGEITPVSEVQLSPGFGPRHIAFVESAGKAYLIGELSSKIAVLDYNEEAGIFTVQQVVKTIPNDYKDQNGGAAIRVSNDDKYVYVSNRGHDSLAVFKILDDGDLERIQIISTEGEFPRDFNFNSDQSFLIVVNQNTNNATLYERNPETGKLTMVQKDFAVPEGTCVAPRK
ncbi:lactonase family protein [Fructilactobacillus fructivorans]|uniref:6-phosphogluconolactonase n=1 Tax=Fructilactobacillus fructivorans TaxID=1614 RepID=A0A0C1M5X6_9LACO|nr:lactonase family protein [Fructilactobacillus fructivorans]KID41634.1 6-phosphogluconolactonase [Fructilactobacillus fructivorans]MCT0151285.1 lactonase family protein [Fructilactobacillus fructivorans]MCT2867638.1 lactonase family protein [Fructilactobacillus fructivorans]MCT2868844.1 lactonase family protein [Fructilactobacillus fructivorans]MCT2873986.1 lactonase family protein [Fructilactobacillus fructivorans]